MEQRSRIRDTSAQDTVLPAHALRRRRHTRWLAIGGAAVAVWRTFVPLRALFQALAGTVAGYRDGDFSFGIS